jgi:hypothetical protein
VVQGAGGELTSARVVGVTWWPGRTIVVRYQVKVSGGPLEGPHLFVAAAGRIPDGAVVVEGEGQRVGLWRVPHDPALPGLSSAMDDGVVTQMLQDLGAGDRSVITGLRAYRPMRRAVIEARGEEHSVFLKVLRPDRVRRLHALHRSLSTAVTIPESLGVDENLGIVALQAMPGTTLRHALETPGQALPDVERLVTLVDLPAPESDRVIPSPLERLAGSIGLIDRLTPELSVELELLVQGIGEERLPAGHPVHGDYYEAQVMVDGGRVTGLLDVDTYGWGRPADDPATMLAHLSVWASLSRQPSRVRDLGNQLLGIWDGIVDPIDLRRRSAAAVVSLAIGPFRVQTANWPGEIAQRLAIARRWVESADRVAGFPLP